jgi:hypothetical protein
LICFDGFRGFSPSAGTPKTGRPYVISPRKIDKNSVWGGLNIQKRRLCFKGILAQDLGFVLRAFSAGIRGIFGLEAERGRFQRFAEVRQAFLRLKNLGVLGVLA